LADVTTGNGGVTVASLPLADVAETVDSDVTTSLFCDDNTSWEDDARAEYTRLSNFSTAEELLVAVAEALLLAETAAVVLLLAEVVVLLWIETEADVLDMEAVVVSSHEWAVSPTR